MDVLLAKDSELAEERIAGDMFGSKFASKGGRASKKNGARRTAGTLSELSGGQDMAYIEYNKSRNKELKTKNVKNSFLRKLQSGTANAKKAAKG